MKDGALQGGNSTQIPKLKGNAADDVNAQFDEEFVDLGILYADVLPERSEQKVGRCMCLDNGKFLPSGPSRHLISSLASRCRMEFAIRLKNLHHVINTRTYRRGLCSGATHCCTANGRFRPTPPPGR